MFGRRRKALDPRPAAPGSDPVVVTGSGPVSAIGCGRNEFWDALVAGRPGFGPITLCDVGDSPSRIAAEVKDFDLERYVQGGRAMARQLPRPVQLALASSVLALHDAEIDLDACDADRLGIHVGTSVANLEFTFELQRRRAAGRPPPAHSAFYAFNHSTACILSSFFNIRGPVHTTTSGCNSGLDALGQSMHMIQSGAVDAMLVVGTDCEVVPEIMSVLNASGSLSTRWNDEPHRASRPFDRGRDGNVIGEGAGALVLESLTHALRRKARIYARLAGYQQCSAGQNRQYSHDQPELDLRPCVRALSGAMREAGWTPPDVQVVSANGSSSVIYDRLEGRALASAFGDALQNVRVHSTKSMLGQHGAGSSALQAIAACLSIRRETVPPTINCEDPDPECGALRISGEPAQQRVDRVLVHSIGLGGFYYSVSAFARFEGVDPTASGAYQVTWSKGAQGRFVPAPEYQKPLVPWRPRQDTKPD
jgi:3-oxoacyl-[acyl-carrier-protein] synthase II